MSIQLWLDTWGDPIGQEAVESAFHCGEGLLKAPEMILSLVGGNLFQFSRFL